jgi:hypothetical protein
MRGLPAQPCCAESPRRPHGPSPFVSLPCSVLSTTRYPEAVWDTTLRPYAEGLSRVKNFVKLCAERAPKCPLGSAYSIDNKRAPRAIERLLRPGGSKSAKNRSRRTIQRTSFKFRTGGGSMPITFRFLRQTLCFLGEAAEVKSLTQFDVI